MTWLNRLVYERGVRLHDVEPVMGSERVVVLSALVDGLMGRPRDTSGPFLLAIDGRSSNGKTSLSARMAATTASAEVVHTDDVGSHYSAFGWDDLLVREIIEPLRSGRSVVYRPRGFAIRADPVDVAASATARLVIIEGVGSARSNLAALVDAVVWVQSDLGITEERNRVRVAAGEMEPRNYDKWMAEEIPFQAAERTWERANVVVCGTPTLPHDPDEEVVVLVPFEETT